MHVSRNTRPSRPIIYLLLLAAGAFAAGCSTANTSGGGGTSVNHVLPSGGSVPGWTIPSGGSLHASAATNEYVSNGTLDSCTQCHGADLSGGISKVSCFGNPVGCHHGTIAAWATPQVHGVWAKKAPGDGSFFACQICHGKTFSGGGAQTACSTCHTVDAPHPPKPWLSSTGFTHTNTNPANAPVCALCHYPGSTNNPAGHPATPASAGTPPGCFNNTLCHGAVGAPHPLGNPAWYTTPPAAQPHGDAAKATPGATTGFDYCQNCHGTGTTSPANFGGGSSSVSCYTCHAVNAPHAPAPWRASAGSTYTHTSTDTANAPVCQQCHFPGSPNNPAGQPATPAPPGTPPGCFNNTLCHGAGAGAPHPVPYNDASHYTVTAAAFPASCSACHDVSAPTVKPGPACQTCHVSASPLTSLNCTSCHAAPPDSGAPAGAAYPNIAGAHATHIALNSAGTPIACDTCHSGLGAGTLNHYNRANNVPGENALRVPPGDVALLATYNAKTVPFSFDNTALSCSNVSCHGGQATPNWQTGTLNVNTQCTSCHVFGTSLGNPQYNSPYSGRHNINSSHRTCTNCHNTTTLAPNHFTTLSTTTMEGPASATIGGTGTSIPAGGYIPATGSCSPSCHGTETW